MSDSELTATESRAQNPDSIEQTDGNNEVHDHDF